MSYVKPEGITGLDTGHALYADVERFYEFGQLNKELVSDTAITTTAVAVNDDVDIGDCLEFDAAGDVVTPSLSFDGGGKTILLVHKVNATFGSGTADVGYLYMVDAGHILDINLRNGTQYSTTLRGNYGTELILNSNALADQAALDALRCVAITLSATGGIKYAINGVIDNSTATTTNEFLTAKNVAIMSTFGAGVTSDRLGALVLFDRVLTDGELTTLTANPWGLVGVPDPRAIVDIDTDNIVQAGQVGVMITCNSLDTAPTVQTVTLEGEALTVTDWNSGNPYVTVPTHINLKWGASYTLSITDDTGTVTLAGVTLTAPSGWETIALSSIPSDSAESMYKFSQTDAGVSNFTASVGDSLLLETQADLTFNNQTIPTVLPPRTVTFSYKWWDEILSTYTAVSSATINDLGLPNVPDSLIVVDSLTEGRTTAVIEFSYPGADITSFQYNIGDGWIATTSPLSLSGLTESTLYSLQLRPMYNDIPGGITNSPFTTLDAVDNTPNAFTIAPLTGQALSSAVTFAAFTVLGVDAGVDIPVTITGGTYSVSTDNGETWGAPTASNTNVRLNYQIRVHHTTSATYNDPTNTVITVGGVSATATSTTKADDIIPVITLLGSATEEVNEGGSWIDPGATASDNLDGDISGNIVVTGTVDTNTIGTYTLSYDVIDAAGNAAATVTRSVRVVDITLPVISLIGSSTITHRQGTAYTDAGATATDANDGDLTSSIITTGLLFNTNTVGSYTIRYNVSDSEGNAATEVTRTVNVTDQTAPVISVSSSSLNITQGIPYIDSGVTATDNNDGDITADIVTTGSVDVNTIGTYTLNYSVTDAAGNTGTATRTVNVVTGVTIIVPYSTPKYLMLVTEAKNYNSTSNTLNIPAGTYTFINDGTFVPNAPNKDPGSIIDYGVSWTNWLAQNDSIELSQWLLDSGITAVTESNNETETAIMLSGGTSGTQYTLTNRITTSAGRVEERSMLILCENR